MGSRSWAKNDPEKACWVRRGQEEHQNACAQLPHATHRAPATPWIDAEPVRATGRRGQQGRRVPVGNTQAETFTAVLEENQTARETSFAGTVLTVTGPVRPFTPEDHAAGGSVTLMAAPSTWAASSWPDSAPPFWNRCCKRPSRRTACWRTCQTTPDARPGIAEYRPLDVHLPYSPVLADRRVRRRHLTEPGFSISLWYRNHRISSRALIARVPTQEPRDGGCHPVGELQTEPFQFTFNGFLVPLRDRCSFGRFPWLISQALSATYVAGELRLYLERNCRLPESPSRRASRGACQFQGAEP